MASKRKHFLLALLGFTALIGASLACSRTYSDLQKDYFCVSGTSRAPGSSGESLQEASLPGKKPGGPILTPTPDDPHSLPAARGKEEEYIVQAGETLGLIAQKYGLPVEMIAQANSIENINLLEVGQVLLIPVATPEATSSDFKIIPDSELVNSPGVVGFNLAEFIQSQAGCRSVQISVC